MDMERLDPLLMFMGGREGGASRPTERTDLTVKEYARVEGVTERTVWTWISKKAVKVRRTPGGRVRIQI